MNQTVRVKVNMRREMFAHQGRAEKISCWHCLHKLANVSSYALPSFWNVVSDLGWVGEVDTVCIWSGVVWMLTWWSRQLGILWFSKPQWDIFNQSVMHLSVCNAHVHMWSDRWSFILSDFYKEWMHTQIPVTLRVQSTQKNYLRNVKLPVKCCSAGRFQRYILTPSVMYGIRLAVNIPAFQPEGREYGSFQCWSISELGSVRLVMTPSLKWCTLAFNH